MPELIELSTERLHLRQWRKSDREPFARLNADPQVMEFFPNLLDRSASDALADRIEAKISEQGWGWGAAELRATQEFIGFVGLNNPAVKLPFSPCVEVGWRLAFPYWGNGYASEAAQEALRIGFEILNFDEIVSFTAIHNRRSRAVMERLNMREMPETFLHPNLPQGHPLSEHCLYKLLRSEFKQHTRERNTPMKPNTLQAVLNTLQEVDGELKGSIYFAKFDKTVSLHFYPDLREQSERYIETFLNWGEDLFKKLQSSSYKYCQDFQAAIGEVNVEINSPEEIWSHCTPVGVTFESYSQDPSSTFIDIELNCDWEEEHGMQWLVKNTDEPIFVGAYDGVSIDFALELDEDRGNFA